MKIASSRMNWEKYEDLITVSVQWSIAFTTLHTWKSALASVDSRLSRRYAQSAILRQFSKRHRARETMADSSGCSFAYLKVEFWSSSLK